MKNILILVFSIIAGSLFAQATRITVTSDATSVTVDNGYQAKVIPICDFHWSLTGDYLKLWQAWNGEQIPGGKLRFFTVNGQTSQAGKLSALGAITSSCDGSGGGGSGNGLCLADTITQASAGFAIGDPVLFDDGVLIDASVNSLLPAQAVITSIPDANTIIISYGGSCEATAHGFTIDSSYYTGMVSGVLIDASKPDTIQFLFKPLDANTLTIAIGNMYIGGVVGGGSSATDWRSLKQQATGTSFIADSLQNQANGTIDTVFLPIPTIPGEFRCIDNQTAGSLIVDPLGTSEVEGDANYTIPAGGTVCFYYSTEGATVINWFIMSDGGLSWGGTTFGNYYTSSFQDTAWMENYDDFQKKIVRAGGLNFGEADLMGRNLVLNPPDSVFSAYSIPFYVTLTDQGAQSSLDFSDYRFSDYRGYPYAEVAFVDCVSGNDSNSGVNWSTAKKAIYPLITADSDNNPDIIFLRGRWNLYPTNLCQASTVYRPVTIIGVKDSNGEFPVLIAGDTMTWVARGGFTNVYKTVRKGTLNTASPILVDVAGNYDSYGDIIPPSLVASIAAVDATANTVYVSGDTIYFHAHDSRILTGLQDSIFIFRQDRQGAFGRRNDYFFENLECWGGGGIAIAASAVGYRLDTLDITRAFLKNCRFKYSSANYDGGFDQTVDENCELYLEDCLASANGYDGFNYHGTGTSGKIYENRCIAYNNGHLNSWAFNTGGMNASTTHEAITSIRMNGLYYDTGGTPVNDVGTSKSWMVNCTAYNTLGLTGQAAIGLNNAFGWLDYCKVPIALNTNQYTISGTGGNLVVRWSYRGWTTTPTLGTTTGTITIQK